MSEKQKQIVEETDRRKQDIAITQFLLKYNLFLELGKNKQGFKMYRKPKRPHRRNRFS